MRRKYSPVTTQFTSLLRYFCVEIKVDSSNIMADVEEEYEEPAYEDEEAVEPEYGAEEEEEFVAEGVATEIKLFGKWAFDDIEVRDISLVVSKLPVLC